jgi:hypothetical protein
VTFGAVLHTEVSTIEALAARQAGFALFRNGCRYVTRGETFWAVQSIVERLADRADAYLGKDMMRPGIVHEMHAAVCELRNACIAAASLKPEQFVSKAKGNYIQDLLAAYEKWLDENKAVDFAGLLPYISPMEEDVLVIVPADLPLAPVEVKMLRKMADNRLVVLADDKPLAASFAWGAAADGEKQFVAENRNGGDGGGAGNVPAHFRCANPFRPGGNDRVGLQSVRWRHTYIGFIPAGALHVLPGASPGIFIDGASGIVPAHVD